MFRNAAIKISIIFTAIVMVMSLTVSALIYVNTASRSSFIFFELLPEQREEIPNTQKLLDADNFTLLMQDQYDATMSRTLIIIIFINTLMLLGIGSLSYILTRRALNDIEQMYVARSQFASYASHSLRTPLANMLLDTEVTLSDDSVSADELREQLRRNLDEINRLKSLSKSLLKLSSIDPSGLEFKNIDLLDLIKNTVERYDPDHSRVKIKTSSKKRANVRVNVSGIDEVFAILINNAYLYSENESKIEIQMKVKEKMVSVSVNSKGKYIPSDKLKYMFEPYYRAEDAYGGEGAGLGLALARQIMELHKGTISAYSHSNHTTEFRVELPVKK